MKNDKAPSTATTVTPPQGRPIKYPTVSVKARFGVDDAITDSEAGILLGWETEIQFRARMVRELPTTKPEHWEYGDNFLLRDASVFEEKSDGRIILKGQKVRCVNNLDNREFDVQWCMKLVQTILNGKWAGPTTIPGETVNGSTVVISRSAKVESGQHSLIAVKIAHQMWEPNPEKYPFWKNIKNSKGVLTGPFIETILVRGISEHPDVLMTVDDCKARSAADVFYTSPLFRSLPQGDRSECSRMLASAVDLLWERTDTKGYRTHTEVVGFADRHKKILQCIEHIFNEDRSKSTNDKWSRKISRLRLNTGHCSSLLYLMGCSESDGAKYRNGYPPSEKGLKWTTWDKATNFWTMVGSSKEFEAVRIAINNLVQTSTDQEDGNLGMGGRLPEKLAIIAKAWDAFVAGHQPTPRDLHLSYNTLTDDGLPLPEGRIKLLDKADFHGIDVPNESEASDPPAAPDQVEAEKEKIQIDRALEAAAKKNHLPPSAEAIRIAAKLKAMRDAKAAKTSA